MAPTRRKSIDAKWLAHLALARRDGDPMAFSNKVGKRNLRKLTARRKLILKSFMATFQANQEAHGRYGSDAWINSVLKYLNEPRHELLPLDIENWLETDNFFKTFNQIFQYRADSADGDMVILAQSTVAAEVAIGNDVEIIDVTEDAEGPSSEANRATTAKEGEIPENIERTEVAIPPPKSSVKMSITTEKLHDYVSRMYDYIVELRNEERADIRRLELEPYYTLISTFKILLANNPRRT